MLEDLTTISSTLSTIDAFGANDDVKTTVSSTLTTATSSMHNHNITHENYIIADAYVESLSDQEIDNLTKEIDIKVKTLTM